MEEFLVQHKPTGKYEEVGLDSGIAVDADGRIYAGMGVDFSDYNNDKWPDVLVSDLANQKYALYRNAGDGTFSYDSYPTGVASTCHDAKTAGTVAALPEKPAAHAAEIFQLIDSVYRKEQLPEIEDGRKGQPNPLNANFNKQAFRDLWSRIHQKAIYSVHF
jgi:hypothetical protein